MGLLLYVKSQYAKLGHDFFLPHPFQLPVLHTLSLDSTWSEPLTATLNKNNNKFITERGLSHEPFMMGDFLHFPIRHKCLNTVQ